MLPFYEKKINWKIEDKSPGDCFNMFTISTSCNRKFVVCLFDDKETNRSYPFATD